MAGCRKFKLEYVSRDDIAALTLDSAAVSNIPFIMKVDEHQVQQLLEA